MSDKITQSFLDAITAMVPDGWRAVDYRHATMNDWYVPRMEKVAIEWVLRGHYSDGKYIIVERIPLTGRAWAVENLVTRPGSVFTKDGKEWSVIMEAGLIMIGPCIRELGDFTLLDQTNEWCDWPDEFDHLSDATVKWLYKAERTVTDEGS